MNEQDYVSIDYYTSKQQDCITQPVKNKSLKERKFFNWLSTFCQRQSSLQFWDAATQKSMFWKPRQPPDMIQSSWNISLCFFSTTHHFCLRPSLLHLWSPNTEHQHLENDNTLASTWFAAEFRLRRLNLVLCWAKKTKKNNWVSVWIALEHFFRGKWTVRSGTQCSDTHGVSSYPNLIFWGILTFLMLELTFSLFLYSVRWAFHVSRTIEM